MDTESAGSKVAMIQMVMMGKLTRLVFFVHWRTFSLIVVIKGLQKEICTDERSANP